MSLPIILPQPDALPLPAPAWLLQILLQLTFLLHLLAMNALLGGLLITFWARLRGRTPAWSGLADAIAGVSPSLVAATVTLGVAPLLFLQALFGQFLFTSSIMMAWGWFSVVVVLIPAYYGTYLQARVGERLGVWRTPTLGLILMGFLWVGFMFANNTTLMLRPELWPGLYFADAGGRHLNLEDTILWPRYLHMVLGATAVAGLMLAAWGRARVKSDATTGGRMIARGLDVFTLVTALNVGAGLWYVLSLPASVFGLFVGGSALLSALLGVGIALAAVLLFLAWTVRKRAEAANPWPLLLLTVLQMVVMITLRDLLRGAALGDHYRPAAFAVEAQWMELSLFAVLLLGGIATLVWLLLTLYRNRENGAG